MRRGARFHSAALRSSPSAHMNLTTARWRLEARATASIAGAVRLPTWVRAARRAPSGNRRIAQRHGGLIVSKAGEDNPLMQRARASRKVAEVEARRSGSKKRLSAVSARRVVNRSLARCRSCGSRGRHRAKKRRDPDRGGEVARSGKGRVGSLSWETRSENRDAIPFDGRHLGR